MLDNKASQAAPSTSMLTIAQVSELLHVHPNSIRRWTNEGLLPCYRVGIRGDRRFSTDDLSQFIEVGGGNRNADRTNGI